MGKLKTISEVATKDGPFYNRLQLVIVDWLVAYEKRDHPGDLNVINFLKHFGELENE